MEGKSEKEILDHARRRPRTCTAECANETSCNGECGKFPVYVADLAINPETGHAEPINCQPIYCEVDQVKLREQMQQILDMIMLFFEEEEKLVESGALPEDEVQFHDVQTNNSSTKPNTRPIPPQFKSRRA